MREEEPDCEDKDDKDGNSCSDLTEPPDWTESPDSDIQITGITSESPVVRFMRSRNVWASEFAEQ
jgi:hypothetical protein